MSTLRIPLATLDDDPQTRLWLHLYVKAKVPGFEVLITLNIAKLVICVNYAAIICCDFEARYVKRSFQTISQKLDQTEELGQHRKTKLGEYELICIMRLKGRRTDLPLHGVSRFARLAIRRSLKLLVILCLMDAVPGSHHHYWSLPTSKI